MGDLMQLTDIEKDALTELINIGFGRSASALSMLVGQRVTLEAPDVGIYPIEKLEEGLVGVSLGDITSVHQVFNGRLCGNAMLLFNNESATTLVDLLAGGEGVPHDLSEGDKEALIETGNILLNAFIGSFGNLLKVHVTFAVPSLRLDSLRKMISSLMVDSQNLEVALVVRIHFWLTKGNVRGFVVIIMGVQSLDALFDAMRTAGFLND